jgi:hypothetical protein
MQNYDCAGIFEIWASSFGHDVLVCTGVKQAPVASLYWILSIFSGVGYT